MKVVIRHETIVNGELDWDELIIYGEALNVAHSGATAGFVCGRHFYTSEFIAVPWHRVISITDKIPEAVTE